MIKPRILVVDDEVSVRRWMARFLEQEGYAVDVAADGNEALRLVEERAPAILITDLNMPHLDGLELLRRIRASNPEVSLIVATGEDKLASAVQAMRHGAQDYLTKPVTHDALRISVERTLAHRALSSEAENLRRQLRTRDHEGLQGLIGTSAAMQRVYRTVQQVARSRAPILISGENGTGKGEVAKAIHALSDRSAAPFVTLSCAAPSESQLESELFGHEPGAFAGADQQRIGRLEQAHTGTLFLDEISALPLTTQVKLLQALQQQTFERRAGSQPVSVNVRVIAATNKDLAGEVREGRFREDLFYRLGVVHIDMPPLRLRGNDVTLLAEHFLTRFAGENQRTLDGLSDAARQKMTAHRWPGNVRELENVMERAVLLSHGNLVEAEALPFDAVPATFEDIQVPGASMAQVEKYVILKTLDATGGSTTRAAEILDLSVRTIQYRLQQYDIPGQRSRR